MLDITWTPKHAPEPLYLPLEQILDEVHKPRTDTTHTYPALNTPSGTPSYLGNYTANPVPKDKYISLHNGHMCLYSWPHVPDTIKAHSCDRQAVRYTLILKW